ncbi:BTAD domain-containing putative transcriptional regulator [Actinoplanes sp. TFC3]|uniref:BTAD domain-containing putative transcriptional regulator n=1 Tax=Actinoplanes sp. TFC3 TaxID=1710355 RepID=UPI00082D71FC|nr:BTAD domain-containing putative transcriptional regulator [Actinoplanes sp. TFC3]
MQFRLLGPFEASTEAGAVTVGRRQERLILTVLLLARERQVVPAQRLIDKLWPGEQRGRGTLHTYIGRLRAALGPYGIGIERLGSGYRMADPGTYELDVRTFRELAAARSPDPAEQAELCRRALALWRGDTDDPELSELRLDVAERYARLLLDSGQHEDAAELVSVAGAGREQLCTYVMTALHRCGRRAEALDLYERNRRVLADLGLAPGPQLTAVRERVERGDPELLRPPAPRYAVRVRDQWLPWQTAGHPALEFCNTFAGWGRPPTPHSDWLRGYPTLAVWAGHVGLAEEWVVTRLLTAAERDPAGAARALAQARELRRQLYASCTDPADAVAFKAVAALAEAAMRASRFVRSDDGLGGWRVAPGIGLRLPVLAAARSAADLLADPRRFQIRVCPGEACGWLFLDEHGRRRWCSLGTCAGRC